MSDLYNFGDANKHGDLIGGHFCRECLSHVNETKISADNPYTTDWCRRCGHRREGAYSTARIGRWLTPQKDFGRCVNQEHVHHHRAGLFIMTTNTVTAAIYCATALKLNFVGGSVNLGTMMAVADCAVQRASSGQLSTKQRVRGYEMNDSKLIQCPRCGAQWSPFEGRKTWQVGYYKEGTTDEFVPVNSHTVTQDECPRCLTKVTREKVRDDIDTPKTFGPTPDDYGRKKPPRVTKEDFERLAQIGRDLDALSLRREATRKRLELNDTEEPDEVCEECKHSDNDDCCWYKPINSPVTGARLTGVRCQDIRRYGELRCPLGGFEKKKK